MDQFNWFNSNLLKFVKFYEYLLETCYIYIKSYSLEISDMKNFDLQPKKIANPIISNHDFQKKV